MASPPLVSTCIGPTAMMPPMHVPMIATLVTAVACPVSQLPLTTQQVSVVHCPGPLAIPHPFTEPELNVTLGDGWQTGPPVAAVLLALGPGPVVALVLAPAPVVLLVLAPPPFPVVLLVLPPFPVVLVAPPPFPTVALLVPAPVPVVVLVWLDVALAPVPVVVLAWLDVAPAPVPVGPDVAPSCPPQAETSAKEIETRAVMFRFMSERHNKDRAPAIGGAPLWRGDLERRAHPGGFGARAPRAGSASPRQPLCPRTQLTLGGGGGGGGARISA